MLNLAYALVLAFLVVLALELLAMLGKLAGIVVRVFLGIAAVLYLIRNSSGTASSETPPVPYHGARIWRPCENLVIKRVQPFFTTDEWQLSSRAILTEKRA